MSQEKLKGDSSVLSNIESGECIISLVVPKEVQEYRVQSTEFAVADTTQYNVEHVSVNMGKKLQNNMKITVQGIIACRGHSRDSLEHRLQRLRS